MKLRIGRPRRIPSPRQKESYIFAILSGMDRDDAASVTGFSRFVWRKIRKEDSEFNRRVEEAIRDRDEEGNIPPPRIYRFMG